MQTHGRVSAPIALVATTVALAAGGLVAATAGAQVLRGPGVGYAAGYYAAPGYYGMGYGSPSLGIPRTYTAFSSPYGAGYGYGYAPYSYLPGRYGVGLWRPGLVAPGYVYAPGYYRTFPVPYRPLVPFTSPAVGYYAPGFGPPAFYAW